MLYHIFNNISDRKLINQRNLRCHYNVTSHICVYAMLSKLRTGIQWRYHYQTGRKYQCYEYDITD